MSLNNMSNARQLAFRGFARVNLDDLSFVHDSHRGLDERNVARLGKIFDLEGCQRFHEHNFVDVVIEQNSLDTLQRRCLAQQPVDDWTAVPLLSLGQLECLSGRHRIEAAKTHLAPNEQWWIVRLFVNDLSESEQVRLAEDYCNEKSHTDGEIFLKIRIYHHEHKKDSESKWWARLTESKRKDLRQLLRDERYAQAFDAMLLWPGLWTPVKLGSLHRLLCLKCDEEILQYLRHVAAVWQNIMPDSISPASLNTATVQRLQALAPTHSTDDAEIVRELFTKGEVFNKVTDQSDRALLLSNILQVRGMIPSIYTFFEDIKYLEPCAKIMRTLYDEGKHTVYDSFMGSFFDPTTPLVEHARLDLRSCPSIPSPTFRYLAYLQLWLFTFRHFPQLGSATPRKSPDKDKPVVLEPSPALWQALGELTVTLGFKVANAITLQRSDPTSQMVTQLLRQCSGSTSDNSSLGIRLCRILKTSRQSADHPANAVFTSASALSIAQRCGRPYEDDHYSDQKSMFLPQMLEQPTAAGKNITSFYRKWNMIRNFFDLEHVPDIDLTTAVSAQQVADCVATLDCPLDADGFAMIQEHLDQVKATNIELSDQFVTLRADNLRKASEITHLQQQANTLADREKLAEEMAAKLRHEVQQLRSEQASDAVLRPEIDHLKAQLGQVEGRLAAANANLTKQTGLYTALESSYKELQEQDARRADAGPRMQKDYEDARENVNRLQTELIAQQALGNQHTQLFKQQESEISRLKADISRLELELNEEKQELSDANESLVQSQARVDKLESASIAFCEQYKILRASIAQLDVEKSKFKKSLDSAEERAKDLEQQLHIAASKAKDLEQQVQAAKDDQSEQEERLYRTEVQVINNQVLSEQTAQLMRGEMSKLRDILLRSASDADLMLTGQELPSGAYLTLHTAHHTEYGVETWVRYFSQEIAIEVVEALQLGTVAHCSHYNMAFAPNFLVITESTVQDPARFAEQWRKYRDLWRWSKSIDEPLRSFMENVKSSTLTKGIKRKSVIAEAKSTPYKRLAPFRQPQLAASSDGRSNRRRDLEGLSIGGQTSTQRQLVGPPTQLRLEASSGGAADHSEQKR